MSLPELVSHGISLMEGRNPGNIAGTLSNFLNSQGVIINNIWPAIDITENSTTINVYVDIPGVKPDSIDVVFFNNRIDVKGERKRPFSDDTTLRKHEIVYGRFECKVILPISVTNRESVSITAKNGVLLISINKVTEERNRFSVRINSHDVNTARSTLESK